MEKPRARLQSGQAVNPGDGVLPILKELEPGRLRVIGTGFYITRYGLIATARHVVEDLSDRSKLMTAYVPHLALENRVYLRRLHKAFMLKAADVAVAQADNYLKNYPADPLPNIRVKLSHVVPSAHERLTTFAYPENAILDFNSTSAIPKIRGDYYTGKLLRSVSARENPYMDVPYFETTIEVMGGASGAPVFDSSGRVVAINCRGWDFRGAEQEGDNLSYQIPVRHFLDLEIDLFMAPPQSWEAKQMPAGRQVFTVRELIALGHIHWEPKLVD